MATLRIFSDIFNNEYKDYVYDPLRPMLEQIEESCDTGMYGKMYVECYDQDTGETFYAPMDDGEDLSAVITVGGNVVSADYEVKEDDLISVMFLPETWSHGGAAAGGLIGALTGVLLFIGYAAMGALGFVTGGATWGLLIGLTVAGAALGVVAGGLVGGYLDQMQQGAKSSYDKGKLGASSPDVRGSENQPLEGNNFPFVIGRHLIAPFVVGNPYTEYSGKNGKDAYITVMYCAGYAPLRLTDFKLGDFYLAYNRDSGTAHPTVMDGMLRGYSTSETDDGPILDYWKNNDISLELIQCGGESTLYPCVIKEQTIDANVISIADDALADTASVVYKGTPFVNRFKTNGVYFTASCPMEFTLNLKFPSGAYGTYSDTRGSSTRTEYEFLHLLFSVQYRVYDRNNPSSDPEGGDYGSWTNITTFNGKDFGIILDDRIQGWDIEDHKGNHLQDYTINGEEVLGPYNSILLSRLALSDNIDVRTNLLRGRAGSGRYYVDENRTLYVDVNGVLLKKGELKTEGRYFIGYLNPGDSGSAVIIDALQESICIGISDMYVHNPETMEEEHVVMQVQDKSRTYLTGRKRLLLSNVYDIYSGKFIGDKGFDIDIVHTAGNYVRTGKQEKSRLYGYFKNKEVVDFQDISGPFGKSEVRLSATVRLTDEQCRACMDTESNPSKSVEVRVIRLSPNYLDQTSTSGNSEGEGTHSYSDALKVDSIVTKCFDEEHLKKTGIVRPMPVQSEQDRSKFAYVALRAKADSAGNILSSLKSLSCIAESFSPVWDTGKKEFLPEGVHKETEYYGYFKGSERRNRAAMTSEKGVTEQKISKAEYESGRMAGYDWIENRAGSTFSSIMRGIVFKNHVYSSDGTTFYASIAGLVKQDSRQKVASFTIGGAETSIPPDLANVGDNEYMTSYRVRLGTESSAQIILSETAARYNDASAVSGFMLACVGAQNGPVAMGYEDINTLAAGTAYEDTQALEDGSKFTEQTTYKGNIYKAGDAIAVRMEANGYIYQSVKLEELLSKLAAAARASYTYDRGGKIKLVVDKPAPYYKDVINLQNSISSSNAFSYAELPAGLRIAFSDENDGYEQNSLYCWADGNDLGNYKGQVEDYQIQFVTDPYQNWLLGRYLLAFRLLQREVLTRTIGPEGKLHELGDVVLVQDEGLLIGNSSARVKEIIEDGNYIYGLVTDSTYEYSYTEDAEGKNSLGIQVLQPKQYGQSRIVTLRIGSPGAAYIFNGQAISREDYEKMLPEYRELTSVYRMAEGTTNVVLFDTPVTRTGESGASTVSQLYDFQTDDICMFGMIDRISAPYKVIRIKPEKGGKFTETLMSYNEGLYTAGAELPTFNNYATMPPVSQDLISLSEIPTTLEELNKEKEKTYALLNEITEGAGTAPSAPVVTGAVATRDRMKFTCLTDGKGLPETIHGFEWELEDAGGEKRTETTEEGEWAYRFKRSRDGYPEADELVRWKVRVRCQNIYGVFSEWSEYANADVSGYGTWIPTAPVLTKSEAAEDGINVSWYAARGKDDRELYGSPRYRLQVKYNGILRSSAETDALSAAYTFVRATDGYPERPDVEGAPVTLDKYSVTVRCTNRDGGAEAETEAQVSYESYGTWILAEPLVTPDVTDRRITLSIEQPARADSRAVYGTVRYRIRIKRNAVDGGGYSVPADEDWYRPATSANPYPAGSHGNEDNYRDGEGFVETSARTYVQTLPLYGQGQENGAVDTPYIFDVQAYSEASESGWLSDGGDEVYAAALCSALRDVVIANADYKKLYVGELSAITANLGEIREGSLMGNDKNYWTLTSRQNPQEPKDYQGAFRVGGKDQYFEVLPVVSSTGEITGYEVTLKAGNITLTGMTDAEGNSSRLGTYIYDSTDSTRRMELTPYGINIQSGTDSKGDGNIDTWDTVGSCIIDSNNNLFITNTKGASAIPKVATFVPDDSTAAIYHLDTDTAAKTITGSGNPAGLLFSGSIETANGTPIREDIGIFSGEIKKDFAGDAKDLAFLTKSNVIEVGGNLVGVDDGSLDSRKNEWNSLAADGWGLTDEQIATKLFRWR